MQNYKKILDLLSNEDCKPFVNKLIHLNPAQVALEYRGKIPCDASALALIIQLYQKAETKLPLWVETWCALTPKSYEQATSQLSALYKSTFLGGEKLLVLGGGLGVDEWAFANTFTTVVSVDTDGDLNEIVAFNRERLGIKNVNRLTTTAENYLETYTGTFDCIYTDPDRRDEKGNRKITLSQSRPDILNLLPRLWEISPKLVIKASPLLDITSITNELDGVSEIRVIAIDNEVKEVLVTAEQGYKGPQRYIAANYTAVNGWQEFEGEPDTQQPPETSVFEGYFFEPNAAILKAGLHPAYATHCGLQSIDDKTAYYFSSTPVEGFMGRSFKVVKAIEFSKKGVREYLSQNKITQANVARRNFRISPEELKKLLDLKDGGDDYLFFTQQEGKGWMVHCRKVL